MSTHYTARERVRSANELDEIFAETGSLWTWLWKEFVSHLVGTCTYAMIFERHRIRCILRAAYIRVFLCDKNFKGISELWRGELRQTHSSSLWLHSSPDPPGDTLDRDKEVSSHIFTLQTD